MEPQDSSYQEIFNDLTEKQGDRTTWRRHPQSGSDPAAERGNSELHGDPAAYESPTIDEILYKQEDVSICND